MNVISASFLTSAALGSGFPDAGPPEIAFAGRSNVGKSTLLATMLGRVGLVRTSSTPGRTRLINFFDLTVAPAKGERLALRFVDLPGYGYAKVSKSERATWRPLLESYLGERAALRACVLLVDARRGAELDETEIARWITERGVVVLPVLTKADKLAKHERIPAADRLRAELKSKPVTVSASEGFGVEELWRRLLAAAAVS